MNNRNQEFSPKGFLRTHRIIHLALLAGLIPFGWVQYNKVERNEMAWGSMDFLWPYGVPLAAIGGMVLGYLIFSQQLKAFKKLDTLQARLSGYLTACLTRYALLEGPGFLAIVAYGTSGNTAYLVVALALWIALFLLYPTAERAIQDLELPPHMQEAFRKAMQ